MVECGGLENRCTARYRGFESLFLRQSKVKTIRESEWFFVFRHCEPGLPERAKCLKTKTIPPGIAFYFALKLPPMGKTDQREVNPLGAEKHFFALKLPPMGKTDQRKVNPLGAEKHFFALKLPSMGKTDHREVNPERGRLRMG